MLFIISGDLNFENCVKYERCFTVLNFVNFAIVFINCLLPLSTTITEIQLFLIVEFFVVLDCMQKWMPYNFVAVDIVN